ncbi:MAG TPA: DUF4124 domain-containing protein [Gammaproteobacteria bacterium]|nr:DUF4124 domain-containing protein [Gammaproteobacteria bacterium]
MHYSAVMKRFFKPLVLLLCGLAVFSVGFGDSLYKWVDEQGNVHYSDKPHPGATRLHLPKPTTYSAPAVAVPEVRNDSQPPAQQEGYTSFEIASPSPDQVFWNVRSVTVSLSVQPGLHQGDQVTVTLDDKTIGPAAATTVTFNDLDRGEHTVHATLSGPGGTMIAKPVTFYIQRGTKGMH